MFPIKRHCQPPDPAGRFGAVRKYDVHTGVDVYCDSGTEVFAIESGLVVSVCDFTGIYAGSPWWNDTKAVMVEGKSGVILYGEIEPLVTEGTYIAEGELVGKVLRVLKKNKNKPVSMLHLECYSHGTREPVWWDLNTPQPPSLFNPEFLLTREQHDFFP